MGRGLHCSHKRRQRWCVILALYQLHKIHPCETDLLDGGASHFAETILKIKQKWVV